MSESIENILYIGHNIQLVKTVLNLSPSSPPSDGCLHHLSSVDNIQAALGERKYSQLICELPVSKDLTDQISINFPLLKTTYLRPPDTPKATELAVVMDGLVSDEVKATLDYLSIPVYFKNRKGQFLACNCYFSHLFGLTPAQVIGKTAADILYPHLHDEIEKIDQKIFIEQRVYFYECKIADQAGKERNVVFRKESVDNGKIQIGMVFDVTELNEAKNLLEEQRIRLAIIANNSPDLIFAKDLQGRFLGCNKQFEKFVGCPEKEIIGKTAHHFFTLEQAECCIAKDKYVIENNKVYLGEAQLTYHNDKDHLIEMKKVPLRDKKGNVVGLVAIGRDVTKHHLMQKRLKIADTAFENSKENLLVSDEKGNIIAVNQAWCSTSGFSKSELLGSHISIFQSNQHKNIEAALQVTNSWQGDLTYHLKNGDLHFAWVEVYKVEHAHKGTVNRIYSSIDLEQSKNVEQKIQFLSKHDPLTGLFNRVALFTRLEDAIIRAVYKGATMAVLLVNINGFKALNQQYGHDSGDGVLRAIAKRLKRCVFAKDTVARLGGDEFAIIVDELASELDVAIVAQKIAAQFETQFLTANLDITLSARIGIAISPDDGMDVDSLIGNAEKALQRGKNCKRAYHFYTKELTHHANQQFALQNELKQALQQDQFEVYYQMQYDLNKRQIVAVEALLRWHHPQQGLLHSDNFLILAENSGLLVPIALEILRKAARQAVCWQKSKINFGRVAITLAEQQLSEIHFIADLQTILLETKCASRWLEFEIDEIIFASENEIVHDNLLNIHKLGIALTISNYAADRPALYLIEQLGINKLKLAKHYTQWASAHFVGPAVSNALAVMGGSLGIDIVAQSSGNMMEESFLGCTKLTPEGDFHNQEMKASEATFYLHCNKRK